MRYIAKLFLKICQKARLRIRFFPLVAVHNLLLLSGKSVAGLGWLKAIPNPTKADLLVARGQRPKGAPPRVGRQSDPRAVSAKAIVEGNTLAKRTCIA